MLIILSLYIIIQRLTISLLQYIIKGMINYEPLYETLTKVNKSMRTLSSEIGFAADSLGPSIRRGESLSTETVGKICHVLNCKPEDIFQIVPDGTVIEHKRTCCQAKRVWENVVTVDWPKLEEFIISKGYSNSSLSKALGKNQNYLTIKKRAKTNTIEFLKFVTDFLGADYKDYVK